MAHQTPAPIPADLVTHAADYGAAVIFMQSTGKGSRLALTLAKGAAFFDAARTRYYPPG